MVCFCIPVKTTLMIPDSLYRRVKRRAAENGCSISDLVSELLQAGLRAPADSRLPPLPRFDMGLPLADVADRDALERAMRRDA